MNSNTALIMFAVIAAFGLATATLVVPLVPQAQAQPTGPCTLRGQAAQGCSAFGQETAAENRGSHGPPG
jgi:hypothetical protein